MQSKLIFEREGLKTYVLVYEQGDEFIWPTLEVVVEESPKHLLRQTDPETGLPLLDFRNQ
jgi:hypothetical protein